jgi:hypothetical protein
MTVNFTNILQAAFYYQSSLAPFMCLQIGFVIFWQKDFGAKAAHKMLVKLTPDRLQPSLKILQCNFDKFRKNKTLFYRILIIYQLVAHPTFLVINKQFQNYFQYSVTICINSIQMTSNSIRQTEDRS